MAKRAMVLAAGTAAVAWLSTAAVAQQVPIIQPGAPGADPDAYPGAQA